MEETVAILAKMIAAGESDIELLELHIAELPPETPAQRVQALRDLQRMFRDNAGSLRVAIQTLTN
jgi:hypothetical protein